MVATWSLEKTEDTYNGEVEIEVIGKKYCGTNSLYCSSNQTYQQVSNCETLDYVKLILKADGTYVTDSFGEDDNVDEDHFDETCEVKRVLTDYSYSTEGNWAYSADSKKLIIVERKYVELYEGETEEVVLPVGEGDLVFDDVIDLDGNSLIITEDTGLGNSYISYFKK